MPRSGLVRVAVCAAALLAACAAVAGPWQPLLPASAFRTVPACAPIDPFATTDPERELNNARDCVADMPLNMAVRTPRLRPTDTGPRIVELQLDSQVSLLQTPLFTGVARLGVEAASDPTYRRLQPRRNLLAANGTLRLTSNLALDLGLGSDLVPTLRNRATATAIYRPEGRHLMYVQVAEEEGALGPAVGMRWQLTSNGSASVDLSARRLADDSIEPRFGLRWTH